MATGTSPNIPNFRVFSGAEASSAADGSTPPQVFYANQGWLKGSDGKEVFGMYVFVVGAAGVRNIPLSPALEARGVLEADSHGLVLTSTTADKRFVRYPITEFVMPTGGALPPVQVGEAADRQARAAIAALEGRVGRLEGEEVADDKRDSQQAAAIQALQVHDREVDDRIAALLRTAPGQGLTLNGMRDYLWNDRFLADLIYDLLVNRKDAGLRGAIKAVMVEIQTHQ